MARSAKPLARSSKKPLVPARSGRTLPERYQVLAARQQKFEAKGGIRRNGPLYRSVARDSLRVELRKRFEAGDRYALMLAIRKCAQHDLVMPPWVAEGFILAFDSVHAYRKRSWDEAFGAPFREGSHLRALRKRWLLALEVPTKVHELKAMGKRVDWAALATELGSNKTTLQDLYYGHAKSLPANSRKKAG